MKIAITGPTGFIGSTLFSYLKTKKNITIVPFDRKIHSLSKTETLEQLVKNCNIVYHIAGIHDPSDPKIFQTNVIGTRNILEAIRKTASQKCKIVFTSSFSVYKKPILSDVVDEDFPLQPTNSYGLSKLLAEQICMYYATTHSIPTIILRISNPYGPRMLPYKKGSVIPTFLDLVKKGKSLKIDGDGQQSRDFIYIKDVVMALWKARNLKPTSPYHIINVCSGEKTRINDLVTLIEKITKKQIVTQYSKRDIVHEDWSAKNSKAITSLSWQPTVTLASGLRLTWNSTIQ